MRFVLSLLLVLILVGGAAAVAIFTGTISIAQQDGSAAPVPPTKPAAPAAGTAVQATAPAQGAPAAAPAQPKVVSQEPYGDWMYVCLQAPDSEDVRCSIFQQLSDSESKRVVFLWRIAEDGKGGLVSSWQTPTDILVNRGIVLDAGTEKPIPVPYQLCTTRGCQAVANLAPDFLQTLTSTEKATATVYLLDGRGVTFNISVNGLADALAALQN